MLYELARPLVEGLDGARWRCSARRLQGLDAGELNVAAGTSTILYLLPRLVAGLPRSRIRRCG